jgi:tetratricopeptide (TPR) repeat protein
LHDSKSDTGTSPLAIGRQQGVDTVLDGSVQKVGARIRVTVQLFRVTDGVVLWSGQFDESLTDLFSLQDSISPQVTSGLLVTLSDEENKRFLNPSNVNAEAYQAYIKGRYFGNKRNEEGFAKAVEYFNQAITIDPNYALAYAGLADAYILLSGFDTLTRTERLSKSRAAAQKALELDGTLAEPHASLEAYSR